MVLRGILTLGVCMQGQGAPQRASRASQSLADSDARTWGPATPAPVWCLRLCSECSPGLAWAPTARMLGTESKEQASCLRKGGAVGMDWAETGVFLCPGLLCVCCQGPVSLEPNAGERLRQPGPVRAEE